jgi:hypothetical protein
LNYKGVEKKTLKVLARLDWAKKTFRGEDAQDDIRRTDFPIVKEQDTNSSLCCVFYHKQEGYVNGKFYDSG